MNRNKLKSYAPEARREFIQAVTARAAHYGLTVNKIEPMTVEGDVAIIAGKPYPKAVGEKRKKLEARINRQGFVPTMEAMAYTWFNRLVAIRYMELHGYLDHGYRVLSHPAGHNLPEIIEHAEHVVLPKLDKQKVIELKLDGTKEEELYRMLLIGQCNALSKAMPFLFESIDDETELLLPDHLLHSDSLIRNLVNEIPDEDWQEVEIIGWLYQFYISEKKDEVIGKVVKSEDIPAATQLFTPNWIVKYLVQNSLGRQWMATYPNSPLKGQMEYYIEPAEQTPEVQAKLAEITPDSLNPEELTLLDPACGSGHILVEAYDLLKAIYQERGYRAKDIPRLILEKNLYGLEIDDRAAQLAAFALTMKARADDRSIFERGVQPHVLSIQESTGLDAKEITEALNQPILKEKQPPSGELFEEIADDKSPLFSKKAMGVEGDITQADVAHLIELFEHGKTFGSLIQVPDTLAEKLPAIAQRVEDVMTHGGMFEQATARSFRQIVKQAQLLSSQYDDVITNPPYMGSKSMNGSLKSFAADHFPDGRADLFAVFLLRLLRLVRPNGALGAMTPFTWMFIKSYEELRNILVMRHSFHSLIQPEYHAFFESAYVPICTFVLQRFSCPVRGTFIDLSDFYGESVQPVKAKEAIVEASCPWKYTVDGEDFSKIPGSPLAYQVKDNLRQVFEDCEALGEIAETRVGMATGNNDKFVRFWYEVANTRIGFGKTRDEARETGLKWFPYANGGPTRKWYGNNLFVVNWERDGKQLQTELHPSGRVRAHNFNLDCIFKVGLTWSLINSSYFGVRRLPNGFLFSSGAPSLFAPEEDLDCVFALLNSCVSVYLLRRINPTLNANPGDADRLPYRFDNQSKHFFRQKVKDAERIARSDWDACEQSWDFLGLPLRINDLDAVKIERGFQSWCDECKAAIVELNRIENELNASLLRQYGIDHDDISPIVPEDQITLYRPDREEDIQRLISYAIGCMMGRYSPDEPGLIYAHGGNVDFDPSRYGSFPADEDGIIPLTEFHWFDDDAASRFEKFVATTWPKEHLEENIKFVAESLGPRKGESARETIRRYLAADFYKHHLSLYKRRPIYWLFSSGKQRGFQALVYLHRYNEGTLARMRTEYVIPLLGKMTARIEHLADDIAAASSSQQRKRLETEKATVTKQLAEVQAYDEKLRHYADQRISLDLDDGVKVNYGKFGTLLAEVKAVTGEKAED